MRFARPVAVTIAQRTTAASESHESGEARNARHAQECPHATGILGVGVQLGMQMGLQAGVGLRYASQRDFEGDGLADAAHHALPRARANGWGP